MSSSSSSSSSSSRLPLLLSRLHLLRRRRGMKKKNKPKGDEYPGQNWEDILVFHILPKLPVKSLFRFKCVCKNWLRWISHYPAFIREQSRCSLASRGVVYASQICRFEFISTGGNPIDVPDPSLKFFKVASLCIEASCNGLLCISIEQHDSTRVVFVGNPVIGEWSLIPLNKYYSRLALAFDPMDSLPTYKLMYPCSTGYDSEYCFAVFSSATGVWTMSGAKFVTNKTPIWYTRSVFKGGILYWRFDNSVVCFDLKKDLAGVLLLPGTDGFKHKNGGLGVWEGKPSYTSIVGGKVIEAWTLIEFKWTRIYTVSLDSVIQGFSDGLNLPRTSRKQLLLRYHWGNLLYFAVSVYGTEYWFICYDMRKGEVIESRKCGHGLIPLVFLEYNNNFVRVPKLYKCVS